MQARPYAIAALACLAALSLQACLPRVSLTAHVAEAPERSIVVFLGDNVYPIGMPEDNRAELADARRRLAAQVLAVPPGARGIFIPGYHDWARETAYGLYSLRSQERTIASLARGAGGATPRDVRMVPSN